MPLEKLYTEIAVERVAVIGWRVPVLVRELGVCFCVSGKRLTIVGCEWG